MGTDVNAIGQSADDDDRGVCSRQLLNDSGGQVGAIVRAATRTHDADDTRNVEVGRATIINHRRCVQAGTQSVGVVAVCEGIDTDGMIRGKAHFLLRTPQGLVAFGHDALGHLTSHALHFGQLRNRGAEGSLSRTEMLLQPAEGHVAHAIDSLQCD